MLTFTEEDMESDFDVAESGEYIGEVIEVKEKKTAYNDNMWSIRFKDATQPNGTLCWDNLIFSKGGRGIAFTKLKMLGVPKVGDQYQINHKDELIGMRCKLFLTQEQEKDRDGQLKENADGSPRMRAVPDFHSENFGYAKLNAPGGDGSQGKDEIPF